MKDRLRDVPVLSVVTDEDLAQLADTGRERRLAAGELLFRQGERATAFHIVLDGALETTREVAGEQVLMMTHVEGGFLGAMALLTDTPYRGTTRAARDTQVFEIDGDELRRLAFTYPPLLVQLLPALEAVGKTVQGVERDREKLESLGRIAAGLAHELNNPAAAAARDASMLRELEHKRQAAFAAIVAAGATAEQIAALVSVGAHATDQVTPGSPLDPLDASDREQRLIDALAELGLDGSDGDLAYDLTEARLGPDWIERVRDAVGAVGPACLAQGLQFVASCAGTRILLFELEDATSRISELVGAVRSYSYLDQAPTQDVDIHEGLESTLSLLAHKLRAKQVELVRRFDPELPRVEASGSELNQVWTNLIDNAIDAIEPGGRITLSTFRQANRVCVEIADDGAGIPAGIQAKIFDAFFTTKPVGKGTGLGLDIAQRIVIRHHGELRLESEPGDTRFRVILPAG